jgi:hypothetical protein
MKTHREYVDSVGEHMRLLNNAKWAVFTEQFLGPRWSATTTEGRIPDVLAVRKSYTDPCVRIIEVKVSTTDFRRSLQEGTWTRYMQFCNQFYYATPSGLINKNDLPDSVGWMVHTEKGWNTIRGATYNPDGRLSEEQLMSLIFAEQEYKQYVRDLEDRIRCAKNHHYGSAAIKFSKEIRQMLQRCEEATTMHQRARSYYTNLTEDIIDALGLPENTPHYEVDRAIRAAGNGMQGSTANLLLHIGNWIRDVGAGNPTRTSLRLLKEAIGEIKNE